MFSSKVSWNRRWGFVEKSQNKLIKILKCRKKFTLYLEILRKCLSGNWQYWKDLHPLPIFLSLPCVGVRWDMTNYFRGSSMEKRGLRNLDLDSLLTTFLYPCYLCFNPPSWPHYHLIVLNVETRIIFLSLYSFLTYHLASQDRISKCQTCVFQVYLMTVFP